MNVFLVAACLLLGLLLGGGSAYLLEENCGAGASMTRVRRVVGGHDAKSLAHPWMIMVHTDSRFACGGSLITSRFVLTASSCSTLPIKKVLLGGHDRDSPATFLEVSIDRKISHPQFDPLNPFKHDIALLRMAHEVIFSDRIRPICLSINQPLEKVQFYTLTGWGRTADGKPSRILQETTLSALEHARCKSKFDVQVDQSQFCTTGVDGEACSGDSGGPLSAELLFGFKKRAFLLGLVSYGDASCRSFGVATNVTHYVDWIKATIDENSS
ncbi:GM15552 [Drosophila sechellia]|uniref:GM15552 n=2 Tax=Drosophila sechellia TaxID=7238 RepID=B4I8L4_DROSE|nr:GM15552 [Drosophila sechellia]